MLLQNISRSMISKILDESIDKGSYFVPHALHDLPLRSGDFCVLQALFKLQDDYLHKSGNYGSWFFARLSEVSQFSKRHASTVKRSILRLQYLKLIETHKGSWRRKRATEYRILIDPVFYAGGMPKSSKEMNTKTKTSN